jgi:hypothetical protein
MDCSDVRERLRDVQGRRDARVEAHLQACIDCALLAADAALAGQAESPTASADIEAILDRTEARLQRERGCIAWLRNRRTSTRLLLGALAALGVPLAFALAAPRTDLSVYPLPRLVTIAACLILFSAGALSVKLRPLHRPALPSGLAAALLVAAIVVIGTDIALPPAHAVPAASLAETGADFARRAAGCLSVGFLIGLPALLAAGWLDRTRHARGATGWLSPLLAAVAGYLALDLHCPLVARAHLLVGHAGLLLVFPVLVIVLRRFRRVSRLAT